MLKAVLPAKLLLRNLYRTLANRQSWEDTLPIDQAYKSDLQWSLCQQSVQMQIQTDTSGMGWGGVLEQKSAAGHWSKVLSFHHSNHRELAAILQTMKTFQEDLANKTVQVLSNNVTSIAYINCLGGRNVVMTNIMKQLFTIYQENNIILG